MAGLAAAHPNATIHDAAWLAGGRLYLTVFGVGLVYTDDLGVTSQVVPSLQAPAVAVNGAASLPSFPSRRPRVPAPTRLG